MNVIIGVDPHKASHHVVAVDDQEQELAQVSVRAASTQASRLLAWAEPFPQRTWAIEGAGGLGYLLSRQLVAVGERVLDVPATLAALPWPAAQLAPHSWSRQPRIGRARFVAPFFSPAYRCRSPHRAAPHHE